MLEDCAFVQQGWQCPVCKRVYSPLTVMCYYCNFFTTAVISGTGTSDSKEIKTKEMRP